jgi:hypothetical protein
MKMSITCAGIAFVASVCHGQLVQRSQFKVELSQNGTEWSTHLDIYTQNNPVVFARVLLSYLDNGGPTPLFLQSSRCQPMGLGWSPADGDRVLPYDATSRIVPDYTNSDGDGFTLGRTFGATTVTAISTFEYQFGGQSILRFAESGTTEHPGQGSGGNNVTGSRGILTGNNAMSPQLGLTDVVLSHGE